MRTHPLIGLLIVIAASCGAAQSITPLQVQTSSYTLHLFNHGNHAVNVAGLWMPGNICLIMRGPDGQFVQYKSEHTPKLKLTDRSSRDGVETIVIEGMLSDKLRFTQTVRCEPLKLTTTYEVEALADLSDTTIYIAAGPGPRNMLDGLPFVITGPEGETRGTFPADPPVTVNNAERITWPKLGHRDVSFVFEHTASSKVIITDRGGSYEGHLLTHGAMKAGDRLTGACAVVIEFEEGFTGIAPWSEGRAGPVMFDVDGTTGMLHHLRTGRGNIIERLNLNEKVSGRNLYQSSAGRATPGWSGVAELTVPEGDSYRGQVSGAIINEWQETISARETDGGGRVDVSYHRVSSEQATDLRLLIYLTQRLEDRGQVFRVKPAGGGVIAEVAGTPTTIGMQPRDAEGGLGPYTDICEFAPGDRIVIPMLDRGEVFTIRCNQPAKLAAFRFEVYFRGLWLDFSNDDAEDITVNLQVQRMKSLQGDDWFAPLSPGSGRFALWSGGMPVLDAVAPWLDAPPAASPAPLAADAPDWAARIRPAPDGVRARWTRADTARPAGLAIDLPLELVGRTIEVLRPDGQPQPPPLCARRVGAELPSETLVTGSTLIINRTAREQVRLTTGFDCEMTLRRKTGDGAQLVLRATGASAQMALDVALATLPARPMRFDTPDPRAAATG
ncbi:MAG: hypothetical protein J7M38_06505, partial [Armatimonadetes bacterium]|nr:hypothetical protein [Armatimonadota bacterium]